MEFIKLRIWQEQRVVAINASYISAIYEQVSDAGVHHSYLKIHGWGSGLSVSETVDEIIKMIEEAKDQIRSEQPFRFVPL